jgi:hypothetical protein
MMPAASLLILPLVVATSFAGPEQGGLTAAIGTLKREQTLGEANAGLLKTFAKDDLAVYARGIQLYAQAQADFNALIEILKAELVAQGTLGESRDFDTNLQRAAARRVEFTDFVEEKVIAGTEQGTRSLAAVLGSAEFIKGTGELITVLKDAALDIWREYKAARKEQQEQMLDQLDAMQWRSFGDVPELG